MAAFAFATVSLYWACSGTAGLSTLGGRIDEMARARDPAIIVLGWASVALKVASGVLALALVQPWGRAVPLLKFGALRPSEPVDTTVLWWRLLLWEPWFLVWGLLLGPATWVHTHPRDDEVRGLELM